MIPKPPFPWDITPERELEEFARLKQSLAAEWGVSYPSEDQPYTSVIVPSISLPPAELASLRGIEFYEEQLLFFLIRLRNPQARVVYVTSRPVHPMVLEYYLELLAGIPASHARSRLTLLSAYDATPRPLSQKILDRPRLIQRIRAAIPDPSRAYLTFYSSTPLERKLAVLLGIPTSAVDPGLSELAARSGSRRFFREVGIACPEGAEGLRDVDDVVDALRELRRRRPGLRSAVVGLELSPPGERIAVFDYPELESSAAIRRALGRLRLSDPELSVEAWWERFAQSGGVVEELIESPEGLSASVQVRINARGEVSASSTHEHVLGGANGLSDMGCVFPARDGFRLGLHEAGMRLGLSLAERGVVGRVSVEFYAGRRGADEVFRLTGTGLDFRVGGTTHAMLALRFLTGGQLEVESGLFRSRLGVVKFYRATDALRAERYRGLLPEDLVEIVTLHKLSFNPHSETGVLFSGMGSVPETGRLGLVAIGNSREQAEALYARAVEVLDEETRYGL